MVSLLRHVRPPAVLDGGRKGKHNVNTLQDPPLRKIGLVTWNVNHFGGGSMSNGDLIEAFTVTKWIRAKVTGAIAWKFKRGITRCKRLCAALDINLTTGESAESILAERWKRTPTLKAVFRDPDSIMTGGTLDDEAVATLCQWIHENLTSPMNIELKKRAVVRWAVELFVRNDWLDVLVLQEVNDIAELERRLNRELKDRRLSGSIGLNHGPTLASVGGQSRKKKKYGQMESYPALYRTGRVEHLGWSLIDQQGDVWHIHHEPRDPRLYRVNDGLRRERLSGWHKNGERQGPSTNPLWTWSKHQDSPTYRPVVVHQVRVKSLDAPVNIGVVHTSPGTKTDEREFDRKGEYEQLEGAFRTIAHRVENLDEWWLMGGDFYLFAESIVLDKEEIDAPSIHGSLSRRGWQETPETVDDVVDIEGQGRSLGTLVKTTRLDFVRNILDMTFEKTLPTRLAIEAVVSGSNWHAPKFLWGEYRGSREQYFVTARVADFLLRDTRHWAGACVGLLNPHCSRGGVVLVDTEDSLTCSTFWSFISDHFPVGGVVTANEVRRAMQLVTNVEQEALDAILWLNRYRLAHCFFSLYERVDVDLRCSELFSPWIDRLGEVVGQGPLSSYKGKRKKDYQGMQEPRVWYDPNWPGHSAFQASHLWAELHEHVRYLEGFLELPEGERWTELSPLDYGWEGGPPHYEEHGLGSGDGPRVPVDAKDFLWDQGWNDSYEVVLRRIEMYEAFLEMQGFTEGHATPYANNCLVDTFLQWMNADRSEENMKLLRQLLGAGPGEMIDVVSEPVLEWLVKNHVHLRVWVLDNRGVIQQFSIGQTDPRLETPKVWDILHFGAHYVPLWRMI